jgi:hypothetical protein
VIVPISGLRITLADDEMSARRGLAALTEDDRVELGVQHGRRIAAVLETPDPVSDKHAYRWINDLPGVRHVDVVFVALESSDRAPDAPTTHHAAAAEKGMTT